MTPRHPPRSTDRSTTRGLARIGVALVVKGIAKCLGVSGSKTTCPESSPKTSTPGRLPGRPSRAKGSRPRSSIRSLAKSQQKLVELAASRANGVMIGFDARVVKILGDDTFGDRHQRFLVAIDATPSPIGTVLIIHNIDLAPRIPIKRGSILRLYGEYEWNDRGGLLHWTHHDPSDWREGGWIEMDGRRYQ